MSCEFLEMEADGGLKHVLRLPVAEAQNERATDHTHQEDGESD